MSDQLYSSLFSLLPQNYVKGDSSCDHIEEAANYIKDLEKNVKELQDKREKLKNSLSEMPNDVDSSTSSIISNTNPSINENYVKIKTSVDELEIEINTAIKEEDIFPLSKVLKMLQLDEGLNVVNCAYSKIISEKGRNNGERIPLLTPKEKDLQKVLCLTKEFCWESKKLWHIAGPAIFTCICQYSLGALTQTFSGRVGDLELAAVAVENSVIAGLGYGVMLGMGNALETLCGQAFGAGKLRMLGVYMQRSWIILLITAILLTPLYIYSPSVLQLFGETEEISLAAGSFALWMIPQLFAYAMNFPIQKFLQAQGKVGVMAWISAVVLLIHGVLSWLFILKLEWGLVGAAIMLNTSWWLIVITQIIYIFVTKSDGAWGGFSWLAFEDLWEFVKLSLASAVMLCLEFWYMMLIIVITGCLPNPMVPIDALAICMNLDGWDTVIAVGFNAAVSVRVSNELGAGNHRQAKISAWVVSITSVAVGLVAVILVLVTKEWFPFLFTASLPVAQETTSLALFLAFNFLLNSLQPVLSDSSDLHVVMLPWSAFGHMIPFYQLAIALANKGVRVSYISTPRNIERLPSIPSKLSSLIEYVSIPLPTVSDSVLLEGSEATVDIQFDEIPYLKVAYDLLYEPVKKFVSSNSPDWLISDIIGHRMSEVAQECHVKFMFFSVYTATTLCFVGPPEYLSGEGREKVRPTPDSLTTPPPWGGIFPQSVAFRGYEAAGFHAGAYSMNESGISDGERLAKIIQGCNAVGVRSCREFEGEYMDLFQKLINKPVVPVGLLPPPKVEEKITEETWIENFEWLDQQSPQSVIYVGFGSEYKLTKDEVYGIANGLELAQVPFIWALRKPTWAVDDSEALPEGFLKRTSGKGIVCLGWAPQLKILAHRSIGGSLFHSGWGSIIETLEHGHNLILLPFIIDQGLNARVMVNKGLGIEVERREDGSYSGDDIAYALRQAMLGDEAQKIKAQTRQAAAIFGDQKLHEEQYISGLVEFLRNAARHQ